MNDSHGNLTLRDGIDVFRHRWPGIVSPSQESPVFLMAAGWRTGSTLLQRMLSQDCLMWGEPYGQGGLIDSAADLLRRIKDFWPDESFFFRGQDAKSRVKEFVANLYPPPVTVLNSYVRFFEGLFSDPAKSAGVERWGVKTVRLSAAPVGTSGTASGGGGGGERAASEDASLEEMEGDPLLDGLSVHSSPAPRLKADLGLDLYTEIAAFHQATPGGEGPGVSVTVSAGAR